VSPQIGLSASLSGHVSPQARAPKDVVVNHITRAEAANEPEKVTLTSTVVLETSECRHVLCHKNVIDAKDRQILGFSVAPNISTKMVDNLVENTNPAGSQ